MKQCFKCVYRVKNTKYPELYTEYCSVWGKKCKVIMKCHMFVEGEPLIDRIIKLEQEISKNKPDVD